MHIRDIFEHIIPEEIDAFPMWAFGPDYRTLDHSIKFMNAWNDLHKDALPLKEQGNIREDAAKMVALYKEFRAISAGVVTPSDEAEALVQFQHSPIT